MDAAAANLGPRAGNPRRHPQHSARAVGKANPSSGSPPAPPVSPVNDATHFNHSIKDPTIAFIDNKWEIYATDNVISGPNAAAGGNGGTFNMIHVSFADWKDAPAAKQTYMDTLPNFGGYKCAPELTYFTPQKKWYFTFQTQPPVYCTSQTPADPNSWTKPQPFFAQGTPMPRLPIDFHMIGDGEYMYLFFTGDDGNFYRSRTKYADFPKGFSNPVIAMHGTTCRLSLKPASPTRSKALIST